MSCRPSFLILQDLAAALRDLPWRKAADKVNGSTWCDADDSALRRYLEKYYKLSGKEKNMDGMITAAKDNTVHHIRNYLEGLIWDKAPRLDALLIDCLGGGGYCLHLSRDQENIHGVGPCL